METGSDREQLLEDEWYHVPYAGEIPEIALHSAIYYLTEDKDGPHLVLAEDEYSYLKSAVTERFYDIIFRDINPENRDKSSYRGVLRTIANWRRYKRFCERHQMSEIEVKQDIKRHFLAFITNEIAEVNSGRRRSSINCTYEELHSFAVELNLVFDEMQEQLRGLCLNS